MHPNLTKGRMKVRATDFRVEEGQKVNLDKWQTVVEPIYESKKQYQKILANHIDQLSSLQHLLYASNRYAVLLIFQAMDAAGKDGAIRHVMSGSNPQGCQVFSYKHPSTTELQHDFLWRTTRDLPERERIGEHIIGRSWRGHFPIPLAAARRAGHLPLSSRSAGSRLTNL
jgi:polyphosphate kinase 2 (PPK2 family)